MVLQESWRRQQWPAPRRLLLMLDIHIPGGGLWFSTAFCFGGDCVRLWLRAFSLLLVRYHCTMLCISWGWFTEGLVTCSLAQQQSSEGIVPMFFCWLQGESIFQGPFICCCMQFLSPPLKMTAIDNTLGEGRTLCLSGQLKWSWFSLWRRWLGLCEL